MVNSCLNCNATVEENYCPNCGQKKFKRIDKTYILEELQYTVLHTNKGFLYSIKRIIKNPGTTAREFIEGKRVKHYKPILLVFVLSGISSFIAYKFLGLTEMMTAHYATATSNVSSQFLTKYLSFLSSFTSLLLLLSLPLLGIITKLCFRTWGQNYYEHVVMNAYILAYYLLCCILIVYPIIYIFKNNPSTAIAISNSSLLLIPIILVWFYKNFYTHKSLLKIILKVLFSVLGLILLSYLILIFIIAIIVAIVTL